MNETLITTRLRRKSFYSIFRNRQYSGVELLTQRSWFGHLIKMPPSCLPVKVFQADWEDTLNKLEGIDWMLKLTWERLRIPQEELEAVTREMSGLISLLSLLSLQLG